MSQDQLEQKTSEISRRTMLGLVAGSGMLLAHRVSAAEAKGTPSPTPAPSAGGLVEYKLPDLPYAKNALDGYLSAEILELHHDKHHAAYVKGLNKALADLEQARASGQFGSIKELERAIAFHGSGHVLHSLYWNSMSPKGGGQPKGNLKKAIDASFGSFDNFRKQFAEATKAAEASAWGALVYEPLGQRLLVMAFEDHQNMGFHGSTPLLVCDVWEHAYYLRYKNDRASYVDKFFDVVNWDFAEERYNKTRG
jgi:Fe-Mn family superoxide dismutase